MAAIPVAKGKTKRLLHKLFDSFDSDSTTPPNPPPKPRHGTNVNPVPTIDLVQAFDTLALSAGRKQSDLDFVGGFDPRGSSSTGINTQLYAVANNTPPFKLSIPVPPAMPTPEVPKNRQQSLTMQVALRPLEEEKLPPHQYTPPPVFPYIVSPGPSAPMSASASATHLTPPVLHTTLVKPQRHRAASSPITPSSLSLSEQCAGVTKAGRRCSRQVKSSPALSISYDGRGGSPPIERFCFQHTKELLMPSGYYSRKNGDWINFPDWIPDYLRPETQVALRVEMEKARSQSDVHGYIYTFEIRDPDAVETIKLKVGRAVNLVKRMDQWSKQCSSREQIIRGWYPGAVEADEDSKSLMKGRIKAGVKVAWCHRLERLIHLELADLAATGVYLDPAWPHCKISASTSKSGNNGSVKRTPCADCGKVHKEIFEFQRGRLAGKEWDMVVKPVIEKWGRFVASSV